MKKLILPIFLILGITMILGFVSAELTNYSVDCTDSDSGLDQFNAGVVKYNNYEYQDSCARGGEKSRVNNIEAFRGDVIEYSCLSENGDAICSGSACLFLVMKCPESQTCKGGECVPEIQDPFYLPEGITCQDSDNGIDYNTKGLVKYRVQDDSVNKVDDYCVTDKELREYYCDNSKEKPMQISVTQCDEVCVGGKCVKKGEEVNFKKDYLKYCNDESCYIYEEDIVLIKFLSKTKSQEGCIISKECERYVGKYSVDNNNIEVGVELNAKVNFVKLKEILQKEFNQEPQMGDWAGSDYYVIGLGDESNSISLYWISDDKLISIQTIKQIGEGRMDDFLTKYLELHPSDMERNLNFFEKIFDWFSRLFGGN
ncbi:hypothetical protein HYW76_02190 [Candidatus Pacearchaeota archaeon]|nr:hypothetical protein [Candidatus Pacearchaeota archaeon]